MRWPRSSSLLLCLSCLLSNQQQLPKGIIPRLSCTFLRNVNILSYVPNCGSASFTIGNISSSQWVLPASLVQCVPGGLVCWLRGFREAGIQSFWSVLYCQKLCVSFNPQDMMTLTSSKSKATKPGWLELILAEFEPSSNFPGVKLYFIWETAFRNPRRQVTQVLKPEHQLNTKKPGVDSQHNPAWIAF